MNVELVQVAAADGVRLDGALLAPAESAEHSAPPLDAALLVHGTGANFYTSSLLADLAQRLSALGVAALLANTRGRDLAYTAHTGSVAVRLGAAYETVSDCTLDFAAWSTFLQQRAFRRVGMFGHSLGAIKGVYALAGPKSDDATHSDRNIDFVCLCAVSPARLSCGYFAKSPRAVDFQATLDEAGRRVAAGGGSELMEVSFPLPYLVTAAGYLDKYGPVEKYNVLRYVRDLRLPTLFTFGGEEIRTNVAFRELPEDIERAAGAMKNIAVATIAGADHVYSGARVELFSRIRRWLFSLG